MTVGLNRRVRLGQVLPGHFLQIAPVASCEGGATALAKARVNLKSATGLKVRDGTREPIAEGGVERIALIARGAGE